jgi:hypothetical protein
LLRKQPDSPTTRQFDSPLATTSRQLDFINKLNGELWFDTCVNQVKTEEFEVDDTPIRRSNPSCVESTCVSSTIFKVEPLVKELKKTKWIPRSYSTSFVNIENFYVCLKSVSRQTLFYNSRGSVD